MNFRDAGATHIVMEAIRPQTGPCINHKSQTISMIPSLCSKVRAAVSRLCVKLPVRVVALHTSELACQVYMRVSVESAAE